MQPHHIMATGRKHCPSQQCIALKQATDSRGEDTTPTSSTACTKSNTASRSWVRLLRRSATARHRNSCSCSIPKPCSCRRNVKSHMSCCDNCLELSPHNCALWNQTGKVVQPKDSRMLSGSVCNLAICTEVTRRVQQKS